MPRPCTTNSKITSLCDSSNVESERKKNGPEAKNNVTKNNGEGEGACTMEVVG